MIVTGKKEAKQKKTIHSDRSPSPPPARPSADSFSDFKPKKFEEVKGYEEEVNYHTQE